MKALASSIERSTWLSAAKLTTAVGPRLGEQPAHRAAVGDVPLDEFQAGVAEHAVQALQAARVGELVEHHDAGAGLGEDEPHEVAADETGAAGDEDLVHGVLRASGAKQPGKYSG